MIRLVRQTLCAFCIVFAGEGALWLCWIVGQGRS